MGAVDLGGGSGRRTNKGSGIKKPKRVGFVLDMTPLVDIAFLLLTFFMFATTMAQPQMMEMRIPPDMDIEVQVNEDNVVSLYIAKDGNLFYRAGIDTAFTPLDRKDLRDFSVRRNAERLNDLVMGLKIHPQASYENMVAVLDELNKAEAVLARQYQIEKDTVRKRRFSLQPLDSLEQYRLEQL
ncbi:MAG: ExbD/TolR family protein [Candidatus Kapaibacterium sp.]